MAILPRSQFTDEFKLKLSLKVPVILKCLNNKTKKKEKYKGNDKKAWFFKMMIKNFYQQLPILVNF